MPALSYDLHVHPGAADAGRWGDGARVWRAAADAGVRGFVWKSHDEHTVERCHALPSEPVRAIASASLNPWATFDSITTAVASGAVWLWGPTQQPDRKLGWDLPLRGDWPQLADWLTTLDRPLVLATGHLGAKGRKTFAELASNRPNLICSITHSLYVPLQESRQLAELGCVFEFDAYTYVTKIEGRERQDLRAFADATSATDTRVYFTSDGGQASTGDPFTFGRRVLEEIAAVIGSDRAATFGVDEPAALIAELEPAVA